VAIDLAALPDDVETLHRMIGDLATALDSERVRAQAAIDRLWEIVKALQRGRFGRRSERLDDGRSAWKTSMPTSPGSRPARCLGTTERTGLAPPRLIVWRCPIISRAQR
jgi:hypothetical protein